MGVLLSETRYMISINDSDTIYVTDYFQTTPEGVRFTECDREIFIPKEELQDIEKQVVKSTSILKEVFNSK